MRPGDAKVQVTGAWDSEEEARAIGEEIEDAAARRRRQGADHSLDDIAILVRASFQMREFEDRFVTLGLPYRVIGGPALLRARRKSAMRSPILRVDRASRPTTSPSSASSMCRSAASATPPCRCCTTMRASARAADWKRRACKLIETDEMKPKPRGSAARSDRRISSAGGPA